METDSISNSSELKSDAQKVHLKPLFLVNLVKSGKLKEKLENCMFECLLCEQSYDIIQCQNIFLKHLLESHRLVISDVDQIGDFKKYTNYWKERLKEIKLDDICFQIRTNTSKSDKGQTESYYLLSDDLPEDRTLREKLNIFKLEKALGQQELERNDHDYYRNCLFCNELIGNNRSFLLNHMSNEHNFKIGHADNIVYFDEFYQKLKNRFDSFQCLYCHKIFYDKQTLKEHMRKKQHKGINPSEKEFDRFYIINYLEYSKLWQDIKSEHDADEFDLNDENNTSLDDWNDPSQEYFCLFCEESVDKEDDILNHMLNVHKFDFKEKILNSKLSFYNQVKLINYIRRQVLSNSCFICQSQFDSKQNLIEHLGKHEHIKELPSKEYWDQPEYLFSTYEDDTLLCLLDDNAYNENDSNIKVIPEQFDIEMKHELCKHITDLSI